MSRYSEAKNYKVIHYNPKQQQVFLQNHCTLIINPSYASQYGKIIENDKSKNPQKVDKMTNK